MIDIVYANAYKEVTEILKHVSKEDYDKIAQDKINLFEKYANKDYDFTYNVNKTLDEQNVSKKAKTIIAILYRDYWATDEQRKKIKAKEQYDIRIIEEQKREKYNFKLLFNGKKETKYENIHVSRNNQLMNYKESFFKKILNKIMSHIKREEE